MIAVFMSVHVFVMVQLTLKPPDCVGSKRNKKPFSEWKAKSVGRTISKFMSGVNYLFNPLRVGSHISTSIA